MKFGSTTLHAKEPRALPVAYRGIDQFNGSVPAKCGHQLAEGLID
jgi:hypothetical protein